jgi:hypothetical protein
MNQHKFDYKNLYERIKTPKTNEIATLKTNKQQTTIKRAAKYKENENT